MRKDYIEEVKMATAPQRTVEQWQQLSRENYDEYIDEYKRFMFNEANIGSCEHCPSNCGSDNYQHRLPCGQWHCWVEMSTVNR